MSVRLRAPWRPTLADACSSFSTSAGAKYSPVRRSKLEVRQGGVEEEWVTPDLGAEGPLLSPLERTFQFWSIGAVLAAADFFRSLAMEVNITPPLLDLYGNVLQAPTDSSRP